MDEIIALTGQLAQVEMRGDGGADADLLGLIEAGVLVGNVIAVAECVAMGRRFGLQPAEMARILNVGSAWCAVSDSILPALALGKAPDLPMSLDQALQALSGLAAKSASVGTPLSCRHRVGAGARGCTVAWGQG